MLIRETKKYECDKCHKLLDYIPMRILLQEYGAGNYNQFYQIDKYDLCKRCYRVFDNWLNK